MEDVRDQWPPNDRLVPDGDDFARLVEELRRLQDAVAGAGLGPELGPAADLVAAARAALAPVQVEEARQQSGRRMDLTGRGWALMPPVLVDSATTTEVRGRVTFTRHYLGGRMAAHGGAIPTVFDTFLGRLSHLTAQGITRTAFLHVDYRSIARIDHELTIVARLDRVDGRKQFLSGELREGDVLVAESHGLFLKLLPGQP